MTCGFSDYVGRSGIEPLTSCLSRIAACAPCKCRFQAEFLSGDPPAIALTYPKTWAIDALLPLAPKATCSNDLGEARVWGPEEGG